MLWPVVCCVFVFKVVFLVFSCRVWSCAVHCSPAAAVAAAVVSAVGNVNHPTTTKTTSMSTPKTWRPRSRRSRTEVRGGVTTCDRRVFRVGLSWLLRPFRHRRSRRRQFFVSFFHFFICFNQTLTRKVHMNPTGIIFERLRTGWVTIKALKGLENK